METMVHHPPAIGGEIVRPIIATTTRTKGTTVQGLEKAFHRSVLSIADSDRLSAAQDLRSPGPDPLDLALPRISGSFLERVVS